jgi:hypothetical protein
MSERNGQPTVGTGTAEIPVVRNVGSTAATAPGQAPEIPGAAGAPAGEPLAASMTDPAAVTAQEHPVDQLHGAEQGHPADQAHLTAPVTVRRTPRLPRRGPLTVMGPWAPVAGGLLGLFLGLIAVLVLGGSAESFEDELALVFAVVGLGSLGVSGVLLADEVRMVRQGSREAAVRPAYVEVTAGLLNGLTPARLLLLVSAFVLFLAAYVSRG